MEDISLKNKIESICKRKGSNERIKEFFKDFPDSQLISRAVIMYETPKGKAKVMKEFIEVYNQSSDYNVVINLANHYINILSIEKSPEEKMARLLGFDESF